MPFSIFHEKVKAWFFEACHWFLFRILMLWPKLFSFLQLPAVLLKTCSFLLMIGRDNNEGWSHGAHWWLHSMNCTIFFSFQRADTFCPLACCITLKWVVYQGGSSKSNWESWLCFLPQWASLKIHTKSRQCRQNFCLVNTILFSRAQQLTNPCEKRFRYFPCFFSVCFFKLYLMIWFISS